MVESFKEDSSKIFNEILIILRKKPLFSSNYFFGSISGRQGYLTIQLEGPEGKKVAMVNLRTIVEEHPNKKIRWAIRIDMKDFLHNKDSADFVAVSHREIYTEKELERAKNQLLVKILDYLKKL